MRRAIVEWLVDRLVEDMTMLIGIPPPNDVNLLEAMRRRPHADSYPCLYPANWNGIL